jgi:alkylation response protein AidB-like acyl-CoA dehydrogenase
MNYDLSVEQKLLKDSARQFFKKECDSEFIREMAKDEKGYTPELWHKMAELGWMGLLVPEEYGDYQMTFLDMAVLLYEMGYACFPGPFFSSSVVGVLTILEAGNDEQKQKYLPDTAKGKRILTLAWPEVSGTYTAKGISAQAVLKDDHYVLSGTKLFVPSANAADTIICAMRTADYQGDDSAGITLFLVDGKSAGLHIEMLKTMAGDKQGEIILSNVEVPRANLLGQEGGGWPVLKKVLQKSAVAKCVEMAGGAQRVMEMVVDYAKKRVQFDRPIASFQAIQHHCADILTYVDTSTFMAYQASWKISEGLPFEMVASMCKAWVSDAYQNLVKLGHQIMGGTGFMEETDLQLYYKQAKAAELAFGDADFHREMVAREMGL